MAVGGDVNTSSLLEAFDAGRFPFPTDDPRQTELNEILYEDDVAAGLVQAFDPLPRYDIVWWSPDPRPVARPGAPRLNRTLRNTLRNKGWTTTLNADLARVLRLCQAGREPAWLTGTLIDSLSTLHRDGWVYSVEVWDAEELVGGGFGLARGGVVSVDSVFHRRPNASKVALIDVILRFAASPSVQLIDLQWPHPYLVSVGAVMRPRSELTAALARTRDRVSIRADRLPVASHLRGTPER